MSVVGGRQRTPTTAGPYPKLLPINQNPRAPGADFRAWLREEGGSPFPGGSSPFLRVGPHFPGGSPFPRVCPHFPGGVLISRVGPHSPWPPQSSCSPRTPQSTAIRCTSTPHPPGNPRTPSPAPPPQNPQPPPTLPPFPFPLLCPPGTTARPPQPPALPVAATSRLQSSLGEASCRRPSADGGRMEPTGDAAHICSRLVQAAAMPSCRAGAFFFFPFFYFFFPIPFPVPPSVPLSPGVNAARVIGHGDRSASDTLYNSSQTVY